MAKRVPHSAQFEQIIQQLADHQVEFVLIGGWAAVVHGSARSTVDVDVMYRRTPENIKRLATALQPIHPYLRGAPAGLPFIWDEQTISAGLNFTLTTDLGPLDTLAHVGGGIDYDYLLRDSITDTIVARSFQVASIATLLEMKRLAARGKDKEDIEILESIREEEMRGETGQ